MKQIINHTEELNPNSRKARLYTKLYEDNFDFEKMHISHCPTSSKTMVNRERDIFKDMKANNGWGYRVLGTTPKGFIAGFMFQDGRDIYLVIYTPRKHFYWIYARQIQGDICEN